MASRDYVDTNDTTMRNKVISYFDYFFSTVFIFEAVLKIIARGFICGKKTYMRDPWNIIDFLIVLAALLDFGLLFTSVESDALSAIKTIRVLRVLRPLKAVKTLQSLRR